MDDELVMHIQQLIVDDEKVNTHCEAAVSAAGFDIESDEGLALQSTVIKQLLMTVIERF